MLEFLQKGGVVLWILVAISAFVIALLPRPAIVRRHAPHVANLKKAW